MATPELLKDLGNQMFQKKEYQKAIGLLWSFNLSNVKMLSFFFLEYFTEAIKRGTTNNDSNLHVYYSNRSAAYLSINKNDEALSDAKKCENLKPDFARGYSR